MLDRLQLADDLDQAFLIPQRLKRRAQPLLLDGRGILQRLARLDQQLVDLAQHPLASGRQPEGPAHLLDDRVDQPAAALMRNQDAVGLLVRLIIADAEVEDVPGQAEIGDEAVFVLADGRFDRAEVGDGVAAVRLVRGVARDESGAGRHARQHVVGGDVELPVLQQLLHQRLTGIEIVLDGSGHRLGHGDRAGNRLLVDEEAGAILRDLRQLLIDRQRLGRHGTSRDGRRQRNQHEM